MGPDIPLFILSVHCHVSFCNWRNKWTGPISVMDAKNPWHSMPFWWEIEKCAAGAPPLPTGQTSLPNFTLPQMVYKLFSLGALGWWVSLGGLLSWRLLTRWCLRRPPSGLIGAVSCVHLLCSAQVSVLPLWLMGNSDKNSLLLKREVSELGCGAPRQSPCSSTSSLLRVRVLGIGEELSL